MKIEFDNNMVICNNIKLPITREQIMDLQLYGYDAENIINYYYKKSKAYIRDQKINKLLTNKY
jgi:hypothetical protein